MSDGARASLVAKVADLIVQSQRIVVFTGAGISTESGIPDFRSPGGIWTKFNPEDFTYQKFLSSEESRKMSWRRFRESYGLFDVEPNPAHYAIVEMEKLGKLDALITQNIDNLHQKAGTSADKVIELHGTAQFIRCLECEKRFTREEIYERLLAGEEVPRCGCGGLLKSGTIAFGEPMPERETREAEMRSRLSDMFIVVGSSLVVYPAAYMPRYAQQAGAKLVLINLSETDMDHRADVVLNGKAGEIMPQVVAEVKQQIDNG